MKDSIVANLNKGVDTNEGVQAAKNEIDKYVATVDTTLTEISNKPQKTEEDKEKVLKTMNDILELNKALTGNVDPTVTNEPVVSGSSQMKIIGQVTIPGYRFGNTFYAVDVQNGKIDSFLVKDENSSVTFSP